MTSQLTLIERTTLWAGLCLGGAFTLACFFIGGDLGTAAANGVIAAPFVAVAIFAHLGKELPWAQALSWLGAGAVLLAIFLAGFALLLGMDPGHPNEHFAVGALALLLASFTSAPLLSPSIRSRLGRALGLQLASPARHVALFLTIAMSLLLLAPSLSTGQAILTNALQADPAVAEFEGSASLLTLLWTIPAAFAVVGFGTTRNFTQASKRLGLEWRGLRPLLVGLATAVALAIVVVLASPYLTELFARLGLPTLSEEQIQLLFDWAAMTPLLAISLSLSAGIGEELIFRGVLQPRVGIILANCLFTAVHAWQYTLDSLLIVFIVGLCLALLRRRFGLWAAIIGHTIYDMILFLLPFV